VTGKAIASIGLAVVVGGYALFRATSAEMVYVKYRGPVDLSAFTCTGTKSSFVHRVCYDESKAYMLIQLNRTWYEYCSIPDATVAALTNSYSVGAYYSAYVKGNYDCRRTSLPKNFSGASPSLAEFRQKYPEYDDMPNDKLADTLYRKFYSDMPRAEFNQKLDLKPVENRP
jgi:hypothetical protein